MIYKTSPQILFQRAIDKYIFRSTCFLLGLFSRHQQSDQIAQHKIKSILVIKLWAAGDSIVLLPALQALKRRYPEAQLHVLAHPRNKFVFEGQPFIDRIIDFSLVNILRMARSYEVCIDTEPALNISAVIAWIASRFRIGFSHGARAKMYTTTILFNKSQHMVQNYLVFARVLGAQEQPKSLVPLVVPQQDKDVVTEFLRTHGVAPHDMIVGIAPGVAESIKARMWPLDRVAQLADRLVREQSAKIIFIDVPPNKSDVEQVRSLMKEDSLSAVHDIRGKQYTELVSRCTLFIGNDSGFMHTAAAQGVRTIGLFGPNTPVLWSPYGPRCRAIWKPKPGCPFIDNTNPELIPTDLTHDQKTCMDAITVADVNEAARELLSLT